MANVICYNFERCLSCYFYPTESYSCATIVAQEDLRNPICRKIVAVACIFFGAILIYGAFATAGYIGAIKIKFFGIILCGLYIILIGKIAYMLLHFGIALWHIN